MLPAVSFTSLHVNYNTTFKPFQTASFHKQDYSDVIETFLSRHLRLRPPAFDLQTYVDAFKK